MFSYISKNYWLNIVTVIYPLKSCRRTMTLEVWENAQLSFNCTTRPDSYCWLLVDYPLSICLVEGWFLPTCCLSGSWLVTWPLTPEARPDVALILCAPSHFSSMSFYDLAPLISHKVVQLVCVHMMCDAQNRKVQCLWMNYNSLNMMVAIMDSWGI